MKLLKVIEKDIEAVKDIIDGYMDYYNNEEHIETVDDLIDDVMNWDGEDVGISFEVGYLRALEVYKTYTIQYKLKSLLTKLKSVLTIQNRA